MKVFISTSFRLLRPAVIAMLAFSFAHSQEVKLSSGSAYFKAQFEWLDSQTDKFAARRQSLSPKSADKTLAERLYWISAESADQLRATWALLFIFESVTCDKDKIIVGKMAKWQVKYHVSLFDNSIEFVSTALVQAKDADLISTTTAFNKELKEIKRKLEALKLD